jgi:hypothetical protein
VILVNRFRNDIQFKLDVLIYATHEDNHEEQTEEEVPLRKPKKIIQSVQENGMFGDVT